MNVMTSRFATWKRIFFAIGSMLLLVIAASCSSKTAPLTRVTVAGETSMKAQPDAATVVLSVITRARRHSTRNRITRARARL